MVFNLFLFIIGQWHYSFGDFGFGRSIDTTSSGQFDGKFPDVTSW